MLRPELFLQPHQRTIWQEISPPERLRRSWALRRRLKDLKKAHDKKLFPGKKIDTAEEAVHSKFKIQGLTP